jgi:hypothetical protein
MNYLMPLSAVMAASLIASWDASSGSLAEGTFAATIDGTKYADSPMVYSRRNTAAIQDVGTGRLLVIKLMAFEKAHPERPEYVWNFYLPPRTGQYTLTPASEDRCDCHMTLENADFLQYSPGALNVDVQTLDAMHVVARFSGTLTLRAEYKVGHREAKPQLTLTNGTLDIPMDGSGVR